VRHLSNTSYALTAVGIVIVLFALVLDLAPWITLSGVLLAWAGIVKIAVVLVWTRVAHMETDKHRPISDI